MVDVNSLYPAPPQQNSLASNPAAVIGLMQNINALRSKQAIGNAFQGAIGADGSFDPTAAATAIKNNPAAAWGAPEAVGTLLEARGKQISNSTAQFGLQASQNQEAQRLLAGFAQDPNPTDDKIRQWSASMARAGIDPATINGLRQDLLSRSMNDRKTVIGNTANTVMGAGAASSPESLVNPTTGQPSRVPHGAFSSGPQGIATGMTPGAPEALAANQAEFAADQTRAAQTLANVRPLEQALPLIRKLSNANFGPGSPEFAKAKAGLATLGVLDPNTSDVGVRQEVGKYLLRYAKGAQDAGRSDQALSAAVASNPNADSMVKPATLALIKNQIGMDKQDAALPLAFGKGNPAQYKAFKAQYYQNHDPRAFAINTMAPEEIADLQKSLKGAERDKFNRSLQTAIRAGVVTPPSQGQ